VNLINKNIIAEANNPELILKVSKERDKPHYQLGYAFGATFVEYAFIFIPLAASIYHYKRGIDRKYEYDLALSITGSIVGAATLFGLLYMLTSLLPSGNTDLRATSGESVQAKDAQGEAQDYMIPGEVTDKVSLITCFPHLFYNEDGRRSRV
jgi:hypothetical protein